MKPLVRFLTLAIVALAIAPVPSQAQANARGFLELVGSGKTCLTTQNGYSLVWNTTTRRFDCALPGSVSLGGTFTLAGNPAMAASGVAGATTGIIFEGATANAFEGLLISADITTPDKTWTLPDATGTIALTISNVATATALAVNGANCSAGSYPLGVDASGAVESCTVAPGNTVHAYSVADSGDGSKAADTLLPTGTYVACTCLDADGCTITMSETGPPTTGAPVTIVAVGANACEFADTSGVSELAGAFVAGTGDSLELVYVGSAWVERNRSNN